MSPVHVILHVSVRMALVLPSLFFFCCALYQDFADDMVGVLQRPDSDTGLATCHGRKGYAIIQTCMRAQLASCKREQEID